MRNAPANEPDAMDHDSFLDIVANIVGILIILVMVVSVRARDAPPLPVDAGAPRVDAGLFLVGRLPPTATCAIEGTRGRHRVTDPAAAVVVAGLLRDLAIISAVDEDDIEDIFDHDHDHDDHFFWY